MNKRKSFLITIVISSLLLPVSANSFPEFPMSIWGNIKKGSTFLTGGTVEVYSSGLKLGEISIINGRYGGNSAFDNKITLNTFSGQIDVKVINDNKIYTLTGGQINKVSSLCPDSLTITFISDVCQYDLDIALSSYICSNSAIPNSTLDSNCSIKCNLGYVLSGNSCNLQSTSGGGGGGGGSSSTISPISKVSTNESIKSLTDANLNNVITDALKDTNNILDGNDFNLSSESLKDIIIEKNDGSIVVIKDISDSFAKKYIEKIVTLGIANGYSDETFRPEQPSSRVEYLKMIMKAMNITYSNSNTSNIGFKDIDKNSWEAKVISKAIELGIIETENENFNPSSSIARAEAMKILIKTAGFEVNENANSSFSDTNGWSVKYIEKAKELGIVNGQLINGTMIFRPEDNISRGEVAKIVIKVLEIKNN